MWFRPNVHETSGRWSPNLTLAVAFMFLHKTLRRHGLAVVSGQQQAIAIYSIHGGHRFTVQPESETGYQLQGTCLILWRSPLCSDFSFFTSPGVRIFNLALALCIIRHADLGWSNGRSSHAGIMSDTSDRACACTLKSTRGAIALGKYTSTIYWSITVGEIHDSSLFLMEIISNNHEWIDGWSKVNAFFCWPSVVSHGAHCQRFVDQSLSAHAHVFSSFTHFRSDLKRLKDFLDLTHMAVKGFEQWEISDTKWGTQKEGFEMKTFRRQRYRRRWRKRRYVSTSNLLPECLISCLGFPIPQTLLQYRLAYCVLHLKSPVSDPPDQYTWTFAYQ